MAVEVAGQKDQGWAGPNQINHMGRHNGKDRPKPLLQ